LAINSVQLQISLGRPHLTSWKIRPDVGAALAADLAHESVFDVGKPDLMGHSGAAIGTMWLHLKSAQ
jgi:hypothetical protein